MTTHTKMWLIDYGLNDIDTEKHSVSWEFIMDCNNLRKKTLTNHYESIGLRRWKTQTMVSKSGRAKRSLQVVSLGIFMDTPLCEGTLMAFHFLPQHFIKFICERPWESLKGHAKCMKVCKETAWSVHSAGPHMDTAVCVLYRLGVLMDLCWTMVNSACVWELFRRLWQCQTHTHSSCLIRHKFLGNKTSIFVFEDELQ